MSTSTRQSYTPKSNAPFVRSDESAHDLLSEAARRAGLHSLPIDARTAWRARHTLPVLKSGRIRDMLDRVFRVASTRHEHVSYRVDLKTGRCLKEEGGESSLCPFPGYHHGQECPHVAAAEIAEARLLAENRNNKLLYRI